MGGVILGVAAGLASSTAVTLTLSKLAREHSEQRNPLLAGTIISWATMVGRVLLIVGLVNAGLLTRLAVPLGLAGAALTGVGFYLLRKPETAEVLARRIELSNPFELGTVLKFGALLTVITVLAKIATGYAGNAGAYTHSRRFQESPTSTPSHCRCLDSVQAHSEPTSRRAQS